MNCRSTFTRDASPAYFPQGHLIEGTAWERAYGTLCPDSDDRVGIYLQVRHLLFALGFGLW